MEFIRKQFAQIREQLGSLALSQKLLFFMILLAIAGSFIWLVYLTAKPELVTLLDQNLTETQIARIQNQLDQWNVYYTVVSGKIMVKRQERDIWLARLQENRALPSDLTESWKKWIEETDMWLPQEDRQHRWQLAKEQRLGQIIQHMQGVHSAQVIINAGSKKLLSDGPNSDPSASVSIQMQDGVKPGKTLVAGIGDLVSGSVDRLSRDRVSIIADGVSYKSPGENSLYSGDLLENRREHELYFAKKIEQALGVDKALVEVYVDLETERVQTETRKYDGEPALIREKATEDTSEQKQNSGEPGVRPNTGSSVPEAGLGEKSAKTETENEYSPERNLTHTIRNNLPLAVKSIRATINLPYSYFVDIYRQETGKTDKPKEADLDPIITKETKQIQAKVLPIINATELGSVVVSRYYDRPAMGQEPIAVRASLGSLSNAQMPQYLKIGGLVFLAVASLVMVLLMLRRASTSVAVLGVEKPVEVVEPTPLLETDSGPVGEAASSDGILQGVEVDAETLRVRKMSEQVATMVKDDPSSAASLVRQWIIKSR